jgi:hypothetical protein
MSLTLPSGVRRAEIKSFCVAMSGIVLFMHFLAIGASWSCIYATTGIVSFALLGLIYPRLMKVPYRIWNKSAKLYARFAQTYLMAICYYIIVTIVRLAGKSRQFVPTRSSSSSWVLLRSLPGDVYDSQYEAFDPLSSRPPWIVGFVSWAWRTRNICALCVLPFLIMISVLESDNATAHAPNIYTLF